MKAEFEDVLKNVGDFGRYQKTLILIFLVPSLTVIPWFALNPIFLAFTPDHWCYVPEVVESNLSLVEQKNLIRPKSDPRCSMYDINYTVVIELGYNKTAMQHWPTKECPNGWQYDPTNYDATAVTRWNLVCSDSHYTNLVLSLIFIGNVLGTPTYGHLSDSLGRKPTFFILAIIIALTEIGSISIPNFTVFLILRGLNGSAFTVIYLVAYIILLEIVGPDKRAQMNGITTTSWTLGLCLLPLVAWLTRSWIRLSIVSSTCAISLLSFWKVLPESPRWLISQERYKEATDVMMKISKANKKLVQETDLRQQLQKLGEQMKKEKMGSQKHTPMDLLKYPLLRLKFILVTICWIANSMVYYGLQVNVRNLGGNEFLNFFLISVVEFPAHVGTWYVMDRFGRRWCSVGAFLISATACMVPAFTPDEYYEIVGVVVSLFGKLGSSSAFMTLYQQSPELYPTPLRGMGMGTSSAIATGAALAVPYITYLAEYEHFIPFLIFSCICTGAALCAAFLPETLNKKLPQTIADAEMFGKIGLCCCRKSSEFSTKKKGSISSKNLELKQINDSPSQDISVPCLLSNFKKKQEESSLENTPTMESFQSNHRYSSQCEVSDISETSNCNSTFKDKSKPIKEIPNSTIHNPVSTTSKIHLNRDKTIVPNSYAVHTDIILENQDISSGTKSDLPQTCHNDHAVVTTYSNLAEAVA